MDLWIELKQWSIVEHTLVNIMNYIILLHKCLKIIVVDKENNQMNKL